MASKWALTVVAESSISELGSAAIAPAVLTSHGAIEFFLDPAGRQHFNFSQQVWLDPAVQMAYTHLPTTALRTLAVNVLTLITAERDYRAAIGTTSKRAIRYAQRFCDDCLLTASEYSWALPRETLEQWLASQQRPRRR
jgi:hypothetical protein